MTAASLEGYLDVVRLHPTLYTLHPTPYTLHPAPYTLHPTPYTPHPTPLMRCARSSLGGARQCFFFFTLVTGPRRSLSLKLRDTRVYQPQIRTGTCSASLGSTNHSERCMLGFRYTFFHFGAGMSPGSPNW